MGSAERKRRRKMKPSVLAPSMLKRKKHCFLRSLLQSNTGAKKEEARGTKEINVVLEKQQRRSQKGTRTGVCLLLLHSDYIFSGHLLEMHFLLVAMSLALLLSLCLTLFRSSTVWFKEICADSRALPHHLGRWNVFQRLVVSVYSVILLWMLGRTGG